MASFYERTAKAKDLSLGEAVDEVLNKFNRLIVDPNKYISEWDHYTARDYRIFCLRQNDIDRCERTVNTMLACNSCPIDRGSGQGCSYINNNSSMRGLREAIGVFNRGVGNNPLSRENVMYKSLVSAALVSAARIRRDDVISRLEANNNYTIE